MEFARSWCRSLQGDEYVAFGEFDFDIGFQHAGDSLLQADNALINIINAEPDYPIAATARGLEGFVIVSFDVTELGTVENVSVVDSSHKVFEKPAIGAAYRSRYKPRTVDGVPQATRGLRKRFRFEMKI